MEVIGPRRPRLRLQRVEDIPASDVALRAQVNKLPLPCVRSLERALGDLRGGCLVVVLGEQRLPQEAIEEGGWLRPRVRLLLNIGNGRLAQPSDVIDLGPIPQRGVGGEWVGLRKRPSLHGWIADGEAVRPETRSQQLRNR